MALNLKGKTTKPVVAAHVEAIAFTLPDGVDYPAPFAAGQTVPMRQLKAFFSAFLPHQQDGAQLPDRVTNTQLEAVVRNVKHDDDASDLDKLQNYVDAIAGSDFMSAQAEKDISEASKARMSGTASITAIKYGRMVTKDMVSMISDTVAAERQKEAGRVQLAYEFLDKFPAQFWDNECPAIGSQYRPNAKKGNRAPFGYRTPDDTAPEHANMPVWPADRYDRYAVKDSEGKWQPRSWINEFITETIAVGIEKKWRDAQTLATGETMPVDVDQELLKLKKENDIDRLKQIAADMAYEFRRRANVAADALSFASKIRAIKSRFGFDVVLRRNFYDPKVTVADAARERKPMAIVERRKAASGEVLPFVSAPVEVSTLKRLNPMAFEPGVSVATLLAPKERETNKGTAGGTTAASELPINNVGDVTKALSSLQAYIVQPGKMDLLVKRATSPSGGELASSMLELYEAIEEHIKVIAPIARRYNAEQAEAVGEKAAAKNKAA